MLMAAMNAGLRRLHPGRVDSGSATPAAQPCTIKLEGLAAIAVNREVVARPEAFATSTDEGKRRCSSTAKRVRGKILASVRGLWRPRRSARRRGEAVAHLEGAR